jgi:hypothetical protein
MIVGTTKTRLEMTPERCLATNEDNQTLWHTPLKTFFSPWDKPTEKMEDCLIFLAVKSDLILEMGDRSHPKTAQTWDIYVCDRVARRAKQIAFPETSERGDALNVSGFCPSDPLKPREGVSSRMFMVKCL